MHNQVVIILGTHICVTIIFWGQVSVLDTVFGTVISWGIEKS